jgi:hypothetical protein
MPFEPANESNETYGKPRLSLVAFSMDFTTGLPPPPMVNCSIGFIVTTTTFWHLLIKTRRYQDDELAALRNIVTSHFYCNY